LDGSAIGESGGTADRRVSYSIEGALQCVSE
jgi:hypothetical protein